MLEIESGKPGEAEPFWRRHDRDRRSGLWAFRVVWHEQTHDVLAREDGEVLGALRLHVAASLGTIDALYVLPAHRGRGMGRLLVARAEELSNYYNCHKVSVAVLHDGGAERFFTSCGYKIDAVIPQHTFKLDVALLRKFLL